MTTCTIIDDFKPLPVTETNAGAPRRIGCEVEFAGLDEISVADALQTTLGGDVDQEHAHLAYLRDSRIGTLKIVLDTALPKDPANPATRAMTGVLAKLIPVEIVTQPLLLDELGTFSAALTALETQGAVGSQEAALYGFGVHLNVESSGQAVPHTAKTIRAFAALEPYLRDVFPINLTRRIMPFIKTWPDAFVRDLFEHRPTTLRHVMVIAADHLPSRNFGLDLYPMFKDAWPQDFDEWFAQDSATKARPSFHFRLPDSRLGERGWSLVEAWNMWRLIEEVAQDDHTLSLLENAWLRAHSPNRSTTPADALAQTKAVLRAHPS